MYTLGQNGNSKTIFVGDDYLDIISQARNDFITFLLIWNDVVTKLTKDQM